MLRKLLYAAVPVYAAISLISCGNEKKKEEAFQKTSDGLEYVIVTDSSGNNVEEGGSVVVNMVYQNEKDTLDTYKAKQPVHIPILFKPFKGSLEDGLLMLSKGDSAIFKVSNDSLYTKLFADSLPKEIKSGTFTTFYVKVLETYPKEHVNKMEKEYNEKHLEQLSQHIEAMTKWTAKLADSLKDQMKVDEGLIKEYVKKNKLKAEKTEHGVYYVVNAKTSTKNLGDGDTVVANYTGKLLDGTIFDSSAGKPMEFILGTHGIMPGWDEGLKKVGKGDKVTFVIPSPLAFRKEGYKDKDGKTVIPAD